MNDFLDTLTRQEREHREEREELILYLQGFEGPIGLLLDQARQMKIDLMCIDICPLVDQYLAFLRTLDHHKIPIASDYLVMAAWLAYLKSRLLLPPPPDSDEPDPHILSALLAFRLQRLQAFTTAAGKLAQRPQRDVDVLAGPARGKAPVVYTAAMGDLLRAYARRYNRQPRLYQAAFQRILPDHIGMTWLSQALASRRGWFNLHECIPANLSRDALTTAIASLVLACLEMTRRGKIDMTQTASDAPISLRAKHAR